MPTVSSIKPEYKGVTMYVTLRSYLERLEAAERSKPRAERRPVPTLKEIAAKSGIHAVTLSRIASGSVQQLNLHIAGTIMKVIREYGFAIEVSDFIAYREGN